LIPASQSRSHKRLRAALVTGYEFTFTYLSISRIAVTMYLLLGEHRLHLCGEPGVHRRAESRAVIRDSPDLCGSMMVRVNTNHPGHRAGAARTTCLSSR
jgi:hypothetical protein